MERLKAGKQYWAWSYDLPATFLIVPRRPSVAQKFGWKQGEHWKKYWKNCMPAHTAGAWEDEATGKIYPESSRIHDNAYPFFPSEDGRKPDPETKADFVRWEFDPNLPDNSPCPDLLVVLDLPCEFPRTDERFMTKKYDYFWLAVFPPEKDDGSKNVYHGLGALAMYQHSTNTTRYFYVDDDSLVQEPVFIPRTADAPEGDSWVMALVERRAASRCDIVFIDTREFEKPIAIVQLPFHLKAQIHGNWVEAGRLKTQKSLVREMGEIKISGKGALEPMI